MRIVRNERPIRVWGTVGKVAAPVGFVVLVAALILPVVAQILPFALPGEMLLLVICTALGYPLMAGGGFLIDRYAGPLAEHGALAAALKGLGDDHVLLQYVLKAPHVLLTPGGLTVLVVRGQGGEVVFEREGRWKHRQRGKVFRQLAGQESVGAPDYKAEHQAYRLERWLAKQLPGIEVPVQTAIVFVNPEVSLEAAGSPVPAFYGKKVKAWLRGAGKLKPLPEDVQQRLAEAAGAAEEN